ncbi:MAG: hypothetical protein ACR2NP_22135, partial [Pirellulaceae bacterium]
MTGFSRSILFLIAVATLFASGCHLLPGQRTAPRFVDTFPRAAQPVQPVPAPPVPPVPVAAIQTKPEIPRPMVPEPVKSSGGVVAAAVKSMLDEPTSRRAKKTESVTPAAATKQERQDIAPVQLPSERSTPWRPLAESEDKNPKPVAPVPAPVPSTDTQSTGESNVPEPQVDTNAFAPVMPSQTPDPLVWQSRQGDAPEPHVTSVAPVPVRRDSQFQQQSAIQTPDVPPVPAPRTPVPAITPASPDTPYRPGSTGRFDTRMTLPFFSSLAQPAEEHWSTYRPGSVKQMGRRFYLPFLIPMAENP